MFKITKPSLSQWTLFTALLISTTAAYYSIMGLVAIFAAAVIPIIIMGTVLEVGKITTSVWLRKYWNHCTWQLKSYLIPAVLLLALLTSMGIFGFLSKAHSDQGLVSGDAMAKISIYDERIKTEKDNIEAARKALTQMDAAVDQTMSRTTDEKGTDRAVSIRRSQAKERASLQKEIQVAQQKIGALNEEAAPLRAEVRKVEAEVGPIKYIAAFIYGDNPDANLLEKAVRWMIILIVAVFDPLAIVLVLAANSSLEWDKKHPDEEDTSEEETFFWRGKKIAQALDHDNELHRAGLANAAVQDIPREETYEVFTEDDEAERAAMANTEVSEITKDETYEVVDEVDPEETQHVINELTAINNDITSENLKLKEEMDALREERNKLFQAHSVEMTRADKLEQINSLLTEALEAQVESQPEVVVDERPGDYVAEPEVPHENIKDIINRSKLEEPRTRELIDPSSNYISFEGKMMSSEALRGARPDLYAESLAYRKSETGYGYAFPEAAIRGDIFVRVDFLPYRVFKFNGNKWIELSRAGDHSYSDAYLGYLVDKIDKGEYDTDLLSDNERDQIEEFLAKRK